MALLYKEIERDEVVKVLRHRGYGEELRRPYGIALNRATGRRYQSGGEIRVFAGGVTRDQLSQILRVAEDPVDAANRIEAMALGKDIRQTEADPAPGSPGLSMEVVERLVTNRVAAEVTKVAEPLYRELGQVAKSVSDLVELVAKLQPAKAEKKPRAPWGSKTKKDSKVSSPEDISKELEAQP